MLFEPYHLKGLNLRNRIVMAPMTRNQSPGGIPTKEVIEYYKVEKEGFRIITNSGNNGNQDVPHFHVHLLGGENLGRMIG